MSLAAEHRVFARAVTRAAAGVPEDQAVGELVDLAFGDHRVLRAALDHGRMLMALVDDDDICAEAVTLVRKALVRLEATVPAAALARAIR